MSEIQKRYTYWFIHKLAEIVELYNESIYAEIFESKIREINPDIKHIKRLQILFINNYIHDHTIYDKLYELVKTGFQLSTFDLKQFVSETLDKTIDTKIDLIAYASDKLSDDIIEKIKSAIQREAKLLINSHFYDFRKYF